MKVRLFTVVMVLMFYIVPVVEAVVVTFSSTIQITNAPASSTINIKCGTSTGNYTLTKQFYTGPAGGNMTILVGDIVNTTGTWFCVGSISNRYGESNNTGELTLTVNAPSFSVPSVSINP